MSGPGIYLSIVDLGHVTDEDEGVVAVLAHPVTAVPRVGERVHLASGPRLVVTEVLWRLTSAEEEPARWAVRLYGRATA